MSTTEQPELLTLHGKLCYAIINNEGIKDILEKEDESGNKIYTNKDIEEALNAWYHYPNIDFKPLALAIYYGNTKAFREILDVVSKRRSLERRIFTEYQCYKFTGQPMFRIPDEGYKLLDCARIWKSDMVDTIQEKIDSLERQDNVTSVASIACIFASARAIIGASAGAGIAFAFGYPIVVAIAVVCVPVLLIAMLAIIVGDDELCREVSDKLYDVFTESPKPSIVAISN